MATYEFICEDRDGCGFYPWENPKEVWRNMSDSSEPEKCPNCSREMKRTYRGTAGNVKKYGSFNHGLGIYEKDKDSVPDALKKYNEKTGRHLIEVGNDSATVKKKDPWKLSKNDINKINHIFDREHQKGS